MVFPFYFFALAGTIPAMTETAAKRIFISACEHSAEAHCANLIAAVAAQTPAPVEWVGLGGEKMAAAGCRLLANPVQRAAMIYNVLGQLGYYRRLIRQAADYLAAHPVDLVVVCDSPALNFHIAKAARRRGVPVLFYVAPQLWAWAPWRIGKLRRTCSRLACILPFEEDWFRSRGVDATFVCNPLFDGLTEPVAQNVKTYADYRVTAPRIALLPGSREAEIRTLWPAMLQIAAALKEHHPQATFFSCAADADKLAMMQKMAADAPAIDYTQSRVYETAKACDFTLVASGSATLQVAAAGCPMAILYQSSKWMWRLVGQWLIRIPHLSLVNILAQHELVPEYMPYFDSTAPIAQTCGQWLNNPAKLAQTSRALTDLVAPLTASKASDNTANIVLEMLGIHN